MATAKSILDRVTAALKLKDRAERLRVYLSDLVESTAEFLGSKPPESLKYLADADRIEVEPVAKGAPITLYAILALLFIALVWAFFSELDSVVSARGKIISDEPNVVLQSPDTAEILKINAQIGQRVREGELLFVLDPTVAEADLKQIVERLDGLKAQIARLEAERDGKTLVMGNTVPDLAQFDLWKQRTSSYRSRLDQLNENIARLSESVRLGNSEVKLLESRVRSAIELEQMTEELVAKKFQSRKALIDSRDRRLELEQALAISQNKLNDNLRNLRAMESDRKSYVTEHRAKLLEELVRLKRERDDLNQQLVKAERKAEQITLVAPRDAIVLEVAKLSVGSIARLAEPLVTLVPAGTNLRVEAQVTTSDVSGIKVGQNVRLKVDAFPFQRFGYLSGAVGTISPDAVLVPAMDTSAQQRFYIATIEVREWTFSGSNRQAEVIPGMSLNAEIITGQRSVLSYLTEPLTRISEEAMTEK